uniref:Uncharacterized protein n=1 Tax=Arion vulgaris TaxID=1028688 RepID=A0A0B7B1M4_9EUPU
MCFLSTLCVCPAFYDVGSVTNNKKMFKTKNYNKYNVYEIMRRHRDRSLFAIELRVRKQAGHNLASLSHSAPQIDSSSLQSNDQRNNTL